MPLPVSTWLSLSETVAFVVEATGEPEDRVRAALTEAALAGEITATGCLHLSMLPFRSQRYYDIYFAHPALSDRKGVPSSAWGAAISWSKSRVGRYDLVRFERAEIERWLGRTAQQVDADEAVRGAAVSPSESPTTDAAVSSGDDTLPHTVSYSELKGAIAAHGNAAEDKLMAYAKDKFAPKRVPRQLLRDAREEVFGKPHRGAPKRVPNKLP
jgi:hypothetical protein